MSTAPVLFGRKSLAFSISCKPCSDGAKLPADLQADDVAKALGPVNMKALESLEGDPAALRTLGLSAAGAAPGMAEAAAGGLRSHDMGAEDSSDEGLDSEDLEYTLDEPCTNCTGNMYDGVCQVGCPCLTSETREMLLDAFRQPRAASCAGYDTNGSLAWPKPGPGAERAARTSQMLHAQLLAGLRP